MVIFGIGFELGVDGFVQYVYLEVFGNNCSVGKIVILELECIILDK